jgi:UDP-2-acetamido-3-amino-2,3-dideoxy-glucuronate N-acetyltransferase
MGWMSEFGQKLKFSEEGFAICEESGDEYQLENGQVSKK